MTLVIHNILGEVVATLVDEEKEPGYYEVVWQGRNDQGEPVASGVYFYRMTAGDFTGVKRTMLLK